MINNQTLEYELTFLASFLPENLKDQEFKEMIDVYFPDVLNIHPRLRFRKSGNNFMVTKKIPIEDGDASTHIENTIPLSEEEFKSIIKGSTRLIKKKRYQLKIGTYNAEIDIFEEKLKGLVLIDFEFSSKEEMDSFVKPECCLVDVTQENFIAGGLLAGKQYSDIEDKLKQFKYHPIF